MKFVFITKSRKKTLWEKAKEVAFCYTGPGQMTKEVEQAYACGWLAGRLAFKKEQIWKKRKKLKKKLSTSECTT